MTSDDDEILADDSGDRTPPIWVPLADGDRAASQEPGEADSDAASTAGLLQTGLPTPVLAWGAAVVVLAAALVVGLVASRGTAAGRQLSASSIAQPEATVAQLATAPPTPAPTQATTVSCQYARTQDATGPRHAKLPRATDIADTGQVVVELATNRGRLLLTLDRSKTPCTVHNFVELARQKYFDDTPCHRVTTTMIFVLQCGDPGGTGTGGPGYSFADENLPTARDVPVTYPAGTVAMANGGANTNGSQFFIVYQDSQLLPTWTVFGQLTVGLDVVQSVAAAGSHPAGDGKPKTPVSITSATLAAPAR